jgi:very-short-patch-repair endonuclease
LRRGTFIYQDKQFKNLRKKLRNNSTDAERKLWQVLRKNQILGYKFTRQYGVGKYIVDFYCSAFRLAIELDGSQHMEPKNKLYDGKRTEFLNSQRIKVIRFYDNDVFNNLPGVVEKIIQVIKTNN